MKTITEVQGYTVREGRLLYAAATGFEIQANGNVIFSHPLPVGKFLPTRRYLCRPASLLAERLLPAPRVYAKILTGPARHILRPK